MFGLQGLRGATDWAGLASRCVTRCRAIADDVRREAGRPSGAMNPRRVLQRFDDLSAALCALLDPAELARNVHPSREFQRQADSAYCLVSEYMQELNADRSLYTALRRIDDEGNHVSNLDEEERALLRSLLHDFRKSGVDLPREQREMVTQMTNRLARLSADFLHNSTHYCADVFLSDMNCLNAVTPLVSSNAQLTKVPTGYHLRLPAQEASSLHTYCDSPSVRKATYQGLYSANHPNYKILGEILQRRHQLSDMLGYSNFLELSLQDRNVKDPHTIQGLLDKIQTKVLPIARKEILQARGRATSHELLIPRFVTRSLCSTRG